MISVFKEHEFVALMLVSIKLPTIAVWHSLWQRACPHFVNILLFVEGLHPPFAVTSPYPNSPVQNVNT